MNDQAIDTEEMLTTAQAAALVNLKPNTLEVWRCRPDRRPRGGAPPWTRAGRRVLYKRADLLAWLAARRDDGAAS
jgi:hypothetical protein